MITTTAVTVTTTAGPIAETDNDRSMGTNVWVHNEAHGSGKSVYIGGQTVTVGNGLHIPNGETLGPIFMRAGEKLYAVSDDEVGLEIRVMETGE